MANNIFIPSTAQLPFCIIYFVPQSSYARHDGYGFVDTFLAFPKGILLLITTFCIIYVFLHELIFLTSLFEHQKLLSRLENNFPDQTSIFRQLTFSSESILLSSDERVSISVEPCNSVTGTCTYIVHCIHENI